MNKADITYKDFTAGSDELVAKLVEEHAGWAASIARSVARAWNMDWQLDGLDGGAYEALLFCARRFDPQMGVPFRAYARRRIHESSTEEARKSKSWQRGVGANTTVDQEARELSAQLFDVFPQLRDGLLPLAASDSEEHGEESLRTSIRQLLASASMMTAFREAGMDNPENAAQYKQMLVAIAELEPVHQSILWAIYWKGQSMRALATEWEIDELTVIREHKEILTFVLSRLNNPKARIAKKLKVRPGLRTVAQQLKREKTESPFARFGVTATVAVCALLQIFAGNKLLIVGINFLA